MPVQKWQSWALSTLQIWTECHRIDRMYATVPNKTISNIFLCWFRSYICYFQPKVGNVAFILLFFSHISYLYIFVGWWSPMTRICSGGWLNQGSSRHTSSESKIDMPGEKCMASSEVHWHEFILVHILYIPIYSMMWVVLCKCIIGCVQCRCVAGRCPNMQFLKPRPGSQVFFAWVLVTSGG